MVGGTLRVGIIGADTRASWAKESHIPAIAGVGGLTLAAVATRSPESAKAAAEAFGAERWSDDAFSLVRSDDIDIVTVCIRVPSHREIVLAALAAGKAVYCESPLGRSVAEGEEMADAARSSGSATAIGLQARHNPSARRAADLVASGAIGRPLTAHVVSTTSGFGPVTLSGYAYFYAADAGANLVTISGGHTLDLIEAVLGGFAEVEARAPILFPSIKLMDTGAEVVNETANHLSVLGRLSTGCEVSVDIGGGRSPEDTPFSLEVRGSEGALTLKGGHPFGFQAGDFELTASVPFDPPEAPQTTGGLLGAAINVGEIYAQLARDVRDGSRSSLGFEHAAHNSRLMQVVSEAARTGRRQTFRG